MTKRFVSWAAVSSLPQAKKISLDDQLATNRQHIAKHDGQLVAELVVPGESRNIVLFEEAVRRMDAYGRLHQMINERAFDVLIYLDRSRLGRKASLSMAVVELCHEAGIVTYEIESPPASLDFATSHDDMLIGAIKSVGAQQEIIKLQERHRKGMLARIAKGEFPGGVPWGWQVRYEVVDGAPVKRVEVDPIALAILRMIVDEYLNRGTGNEAIAEKLQTMGYAPPGGAVTWWKSTVQWIIKRAWRFAGYVEVNRTTKTGRSYAKAKSRWPALITDHEAEALLAEQQRRRSARRSVGSAHRFSQCVWCITCNRRMRGERKRDYYTTTNQTINTYYRDTFFCKPRHHGGSVLTKRIIAAVTAAIEFAKDEGNRQRVLAEAPGHSTGLRQQMAGLEFRLAELNTALLRVDDAYADGTLTADRYQRQVERISGQINAVQSAIEDVEAQLRDEAHTAGRMDRIVEFVADGQYWLESPDIAAANAWFRKHIQIWIEHNLVARVEYI